MKITYRPILDTLLIVLLVGSFGLSIYQMHILSQMPTPQVDIQYFSGYKADYDDTRYICGHIKDKQYCVKAPYTEPLKHLPQSQIM